jgi:signal transduction histidine kinase/FixJ family two-component response regulator/HAMP domain-containing protein
LKLNALSQVDLIFKKLCDGTEIISSAWIRVGDAFRYYSKDNIISIPSQNSLKDYFITKSRRNAVIFRSSNLREVGIAKITHIYKDLTGRRVISSISPIVINDAIIGYAGVDIAVEKIEEVCKNFSTRSVKLLELIGNNINSNSKSENSIDSHTFIINDRADIILFPENYKQLLSISPTLVYDKYLREHQTKLYDSTDPAVKLLSKNILNYSGICNFANINLNGKTYLATFSKIHESHWILVQLTYSNVLMGKMKSQTLSILSSTKNSTIKKFIAIHIIFFIIIIILCLLFLRKNILSPILKIVNGLRAISKGDYSSRIELSEKGEIGELATTFNSMADELYTHKKHLEDLVESRTCALKRKIEFEKFMSLISMDFLKVVKEEEIIDLLKSFYITIAEFMGADVVYLSIQKDDFSKLIFADGWEKNNSNISADLSKLVNLNSKFIKQIRNNNSITIYKSDDLQNYFDETENFSNNIIFKSIIILPLSIINRFGWLGLGFTENSLKGEEEDLAILKTAADIISGTIERARYYEIITNRIKFEHIVNNISTKLINVTFSEFQSIINNILKTLGEFNELDLVCLSIQENNLDEMEPLYCWFSNSKYADFYEDIHLKWTINSVNGLIQPNNEPLLLHIDKEFSNEHNELKSLFSHLDISSAMMIPIHIKGEVKGFLGLAVKTKNKIWSIENSTVFKTIAAILSSSVEKLIREKVILKAKTEAEAATKAKSEFLANMSHEIRTPMNSILGFTEVLQNKITDEELLPLLATISSSGKTLLQLINDILDLSKVEAGKVIIKEIPVNIISILYEIKNIFSGIADKKEININIDIQDNIPDRLYLDNLRIKQILLNLVGNAIKFTEKGNVTVKVDILDKEKDKLDLSLSVIDTGIGIRDDQKKLIFEAFTQQKDQNSAKYGGTGLGLAITKRLVEAMNGEITVDSKLGQGSKFTITMKDLKIVESDFDTDDIFNNMHTGLENNIVFDRGQKILVVDDDEMNRKLIIELTKEFGFEIFEAANGKTAIKMANEIIPDLILMDYKMPDITGDKAAKIIKMGKKLNNVNIIMVSASIPSVVNYNDIACNDFISKPIDKNKFFLLLKKYLSYKEKNSLLNKKDTDKTIKNKEDSNKNVINSDLKKLLKNKFYDEWLYLNKHFFINNIKQFAGDVLDVAQENKSSSLIRWSKGLLKEVRNVNIKNIRRVLAEFEEYLK